MSHKEVRHYLAADKVATAVDRDPWQCAHI